MDDEHPISAADAADRFDRVFRAVYATFHRRDGADRPLTATSHAVLTHLSMTGPLTVGEIAVHLDRSQSTTSEIVAHLVRDDLLERRPDADDARRSLLWLSAGGFAALRDHDRVLSRHLLEAAFDGLAPSERASILSSLQTLLDTPPSVAPKETP